jgi:hopanoid biosynthesis associated protein HpnK
MTERRLIVSGDDFGAGRETNAGILRAHTDGILTSASLMIAGDAVEEAVELASSHPTLAVGLHLVLAQGRAAAPVAEVSGLVDPTGRFGDVPALCGLRYAATWTTARGRRQLRREIIAQLDAFHATGLPLAHVDGHCNMHLHPMILPLLVELAADHGIRAMRVTADPLGPALRWDRRHALRKCTEAAVFRVLAARARPRLAAAGIAFADRVIGMHQTGGVDEAYLCDVIARLPVGTTELYCHPALGRAPATARYQPGYRNDGEVAALTSPRVRAALETAGAALVGYPDLTSAGR